MARMLADAAKARPEKSLRVLRDEASRAAAPGADNALGAVMSDMCRASLLWMPISGRKDS
ncbi:hypothetical protein ACLBWT_05315 [Paenibacillus sp. D51F]